MRTAALLLVLGLSACTVGPDYRPPSSAALKLPDRFVAAPERAGMPPADPVRWWTGFDDPVLTALVEQALAANNDIATAGARLRQGARHGAAGDRRGLAERRLQRIGQPQRREGWAKLRRSHHRHQLFERRRHHRVPRRLRCGMGGGPVRRHPPIGAGGARGRGASEANLHDAQLSIAAEVGLNYLNARLAQQRLGIARANLASQDETVQIVGWRVQAGLVSSLDLERARQLRATTAASIPPLETSYVAAANRLAVLIAEAPGAVNEALGSGGPVPLAPPAIAIPAEVLRQRPDIAAAERGLAAETARIGVAVADLYPALRLSGSFVGSDTSIGNLPSAAIGNLIAAISAPIFQGGQLRARIEGQRAVTDAAFATYRRRCCWRWRRWRTRSPASRTPSGASATS